MATYRKRKHSDTWHWCKNCSNWPSRNYEQRNLSKRPAYGELCNQCQAKERNRKCRSR